MTDYLLAMERYSSMNSIPDTVTPPLDQLKTVMTGYLHFLAPSQSRRNVRKGPSTTYGLVGELTGQDLIYYHPDTKQGDWVYVYTPVGLPVGWVSLDPNVLLFLQLPVYKPANITPVVLQLQLRVDVADDTLDDLLKQNAVISYQKI